MTAAAVARQILDRVRSKGAHLTVLAGGRLNVEAPVGALSKADLEELGRVKPALLELLGQPSSLMVEGPLTCCSCEVTLPPGRVYRCLDCQDKHEPFPGRQEAHLTADGSLCIPFNAPSRLLWWAGGQSPLVTALALGMPEAEAVARYGGPAMGPGIRKVK